MATADLIMPKLGESIMEATILRWHKQVGDPVKQDETVLDIATDKVDSEVPATSGGTLSEILFQVNDVVPVGAVIARIEVAAGSMPGSGSPTPAAPQHHAEEETASKEVPFVPAPVAARASAAPAVNNGNNGFFSPLVLNIAKSEGLGLAELEKIHGTGNDGRVTKKDVLQYVTDKKEGKTAAPQTAARQETAAAPAAAQTPAPAVSQQNKPGVEVIEMDRMRKLIAIHMVESKHTSAHVTSFAEADVTGMVLWRNRVKSDFEKKQGTKITFTPMFLECIVRSMRKYPMINSSVDGDKILVKSYFNIGMATALPSGNLIVPVIKNAERMQLAQLASSVNDLADRARNNKLRPDDTQGGTFTMTNVGTFGSLMGTPIINQPQVAILAVGAIKKRPVVVETEKGDVIAIRHMMFLSLSYDHRIIDGSLGASFLSDVAREMENWDDQRDV